MTKPIILFGASGKGRQFLQSTSSSKFNVIACIDNDISKQGTLFEGIKVSSPSLLKNHTGPHIVIASSYAAEIATQLDLLGISDYSVFDETKEHLHLRFRDLMLNTVIKGFAMFSCAFHRLSPAPQEKPLHLFPASNFAQRFIEQFNSSSQAFATWQTDHRATEVEVDNTRWSMQVDNVNKPYLSLQLLKYIWLASRHQKIVIHGYRKCLAPLVNSLISKKTFIWVAWGGGDLYAAESSYPYWNKIWKLTKAQFSTVLCFTGSDYKVLQNRYDYQKNVTKVVYFNPLEPMKIRPVVKKETGELPTVMLGHAGFSHLGHAEIAETLPLNHIDKVVVPLSYGEKRYSSRLAEKLQTQYDSQKFDIIEKYMTPDEYSKFLSTIDVFVIKSHNQVALSTLYYMLAHGVTVYINKGGGVLWQHLVEDCGFVAFALEDLKSDAEMRTLNHEEQTHNVTVGIRFMDKERIRHDWLNILAENS